MTVDPFGRRALWPAAAGVGLGALALVGAAGWAFGTDADEVADAVAAVSLGIVSVGVGLGTVALHLSSLRRAVRRRTHVLLGGYLPATTEASSAAADADSLAPLALVTRQLEEFGATTARPAAPARRTRHRRRMAVGSSA